MKRLALTAIVCQISLLGSASGEASGPVDKLKITTLSTMLTEFRGVGEWGYAALIEVDGNTLLFDTGGRPDTVLKNSGELGIDLSAVDTVFLSHNHWDHTGGLTTLRRTLKERNPDAVSVTHVGEGIFSPRVLMEEWISKLPPIPRELVVSAVDVRKEYEGMDGRFIVHDKPHELYPGVWITGPIPRVHPEKNWTPFTKIQTEDGLIDDTIPEDQAIVIDTAEGLVVVAGCGHAGIVNTMEYARKIMGGKKIQAVIGGFHLMNATDDQLDWTASEMRDAGVRHLVGAHCTGINTFHRLRESAGLGRESAAVGSVGSTFVLGTGIGRGMLTH